MSLSRFFVCLVAAGCLLTGCARPPAEAPIAKMAPASGNVLVTHSVGRIAERVEQQVMPQRLFSHGGLAGRTLAVATTSDITLRPGEVVLTFDDGPRPGKTTAILATLDEFGVRATFLMLGMAAQAHPELAQRVAAAGHTVGSHTYGHVDLSQLTRQQAVDEIAKGENAVQAALAGGGQTISPFFRFPYLAQTGFLRTSLLQTNAVVLDVDIDSKDYFRDAPATIVERTMARLRARGSGIILFHDIHGRTVETLPLVLERLRDEGYSVVRLVPRRGGVFGRDLITAAAPETSEAL